MVQTSVYTCNNIPESRNVSQKGRGCLVGDQGGSDKVAQFKMEGLRSALLGPLKRPWDSNSKLLFSVIIRCALLE